MNRSYRVLWSEAQRQWVVAGELVGAFGKGKSNGVLSRLACAALLLGGLLSAGPRAVLAGTCPLTVNTINGVVNGQCIVSANDSLTVTNTGTLQNGSPSSLSIDAAATGVVIDNSGQIRGRSRPAISINVAATGTQITNQVGGVIAVSSTSDRRNTAILQQFGGADVMLTNHGTISAVLSTSGTDSASATALSLGAITATLTNTGTISASAMLTSSTASIDVRAAGISTNTLSSTLSNSGTISATAVNNGTNSSSSLEVTAFGVSIGTLSGTLSNSGSITATATNNGNLTSSSSLSVTAKGVSIGTLSGTLSNSGSITATATNNGNLSSNGSDISVNAFGVQISTLTGMLSVTQSGTISATATNNGNNSSSSIIVRATGVDISRNFPGALSGTLTNAGTISATATNTGSATSGVSVAARGLDIRDFSGTGIMTNTGTISAIASNQGTGTRTTVHATGININNLAAGGTVTNSGTISASASNSGSGATSQSLLALGIRIAGTVSGTVTNSGTISGSATNNVTATSSSTVVASGIRLGTLSGTGRVTNTGTISANGVVNGTASASSVGGLSIGTMQAGAVLSNSGTISATASKNSAKAFSLFISNSTGGTINNLAGGMLRGNLRVNGAAIVNNAGTIEIPDGVTGNIAGNYTQQAGGKLRIGASSAASFGKLVVGGTADLTASGLFDVNVAGANTLAVGNTLTGVLTAGALNTGAGGIQVTDNSLLFDFSGAVDGAGTGVDLSIVVAAAPATGGVSASVLASGLSSGAGAAGVFDNLVNGAPASADMAKVVTALGTLGTQQQVATAVAQSLPLIAGGTTQLGLGNSQGIGNALSFKTAAGQGLSAGDGFFSDGNLWIRPFASLANQDDRNGTSGYDADSYGLMAGADRELGDRTRLGLAFAWAKTNVDSNAAAAPQSADIDSFQLAAAISYDLDSATTLNLSANGGVNLNDGRRIINFGGLNRIASSDYNSWTGHVGVSLERRYALNRALAFRPSLRADYSVIHDNRYTETGAGALNLNVNSHTTDELLLGVDAQLDYAVSKSTLLTASMGGAYDAISERASSTSAFAGAPGAAFTTRGIDPPRLVGRGGVSLTVQADQNLDISVAYNTEFRRDFSNHSGSVKLKWSF